MTSSDDIAYEKLILFVTLIITISSCDKRDCKYDFDLQITVNGNLSGLDFDLQAPNAVLNEGLSLSLSLNTSKEIVWTKQRVKLYKDNRAYIETIDLSEFISYNYDLTFPHDYFIQDNGDPFSGPLQIELEITTTTNEVVTLKDQFIFTFMKSSKMILKLKNAYGPGKFQEKNIISPLAGSLFSKLIS